MRFLNIICATTRLLFDIYKPKNSKIGEQEAEDNDFQKVLYILPSFPDLYKFFNTENFT
jgi:hypothetical protein